MRRRTTLLALALVFGAVAGSLLVGIGPPAVAGGPGTPDACASDLDRPAFAPGGGLPSRTGGFELAASRSTVRRGEPITITLTNVDDERRGTGTRERYALQRRGAIGWRTVTLFRYTGFNGSAFAHDPGTGFTWAFRANATGFSDGRRVVCGRLRPGEYRFVFVGPPALAVQFTLVSDRATAQRTAGRSAGESSR